MLSIPTKNINNINFEAIPKKNNKKPADNPQVEKKSTNTKTKLMLGAMATAAIVLAGLAISKGHKRGNINEVFDPLKKIGQTSEEELSQKLEEQKIAKQVEEYLKQEEKDAETLRQKIAKSDERNDEWVRNQHDKKEKEYSDWWNKALKEKEEYEANNNDISFEKPLSEDMLGNNIDLEWHFGRYRVPDVTKKALEELENTTFDTPNLTLIKDKYDENNVFDLGLRYAIVANNTAKVKGSGAIINEIPEVFKGVDEKELIKTLDELSARLETGKMNHFEIGGKKFTARLIGGGCISDVYLITNEAGKQICFKSAKNPFLMQSGQGIYNEVAILQEANKAGVCDVPKLYMANPVGCIAQNPDFIGWTPKGAWQVVEYINDIKPIYPESLKLSEWLYSKGLVHGDYNSGAYIGEVTVDMGGIIDRARTVNDIASKHSNAGWLFRAYHSGMSTTDILEAIDKYSK